MTEITQAHIEATYKDLMEATRKATQASMTYVKAKQELSRAYDEAVYDGQIVGKNQTERDAMARQLFGAYYTQEEKARDAYDSATASLQLKRIAVDELETIIKWMAVK